MMLSGCSTKPSIQLIVPVIEIEKVKPKPPVSATEQCSDLKDYKSTDLRAMIKITIENTQIYFLCAEKMKSAILYIDKMSDY